MNTKHISRSKRQRKKAYKRYLSFLVDRLRKAKEFYSLPIPLEEIYKWEIVHANEFDTQDAGKLLGRF